MAGREIRVLEDSGGQRRGPALKTGAIAAAIAAVAVIVAIAVLAATHSARPASAATKGDAAGGRAVAGPLRVVSVTPNTASGRIAGDTTLQVAFTVPLAAGSPDPVLTPSVLGSWQSVGSTLTFTPDTAFPPSTKFDLRIPAGQAGVRSAAGRTLDRPVTASFRTEGYSQLRLGELLSELGYLPLTWQPMAGDRMTGGPSGQTAMAFSAPPGSFSWEPGYPQALRSQWRAGMANPLLRGAVMAFQSQHGMMINGVLTDRLWNALFDAADANHANTVGYTYAIASKGSPETLTIWHDGRIVLRSLANTGIPVAPTASGTFPVFLRYRFQIMQGTNPDGSHYADPVSFVSYFDAGEAVHYFPRGSYGWPQSLGCVELPYDSAERAWPYLTYGSLVTVTG